MIIVWGRVEIQPEHLETAKSISMEHVERSLAEPGCLHHSAQIPIDNSNAVVFYEEWQDMAALQVHFKVPASIRFVESIAKIAVAPPTLKIFDSEQLQ